MLMFLVGLTVGVGVDLLFAFRRLVIIRLNQREALAQTDIVLCEDATVFQSADGELGWYKNWRRLMR